MIHRFFSLQGRCGKVDFSSIRYRDFDQQAEFAIPRLRVSGCEIRDLAVENALQKITLRISWSISLFMWVRQSGNAIALNGRTRIRKRPDWRVRAFSVEHRRAFVTLLLSHQGVDQ